MSKIKDNPDIITKCPIGRKDIASGACLSNCRNINGCDHIWDRGGDRRLMWPWLFPCKLCGLIIHARVGPERDCYLLKFKVRDFMS